MANTYTQLYIHIVFAVKNRENLVAARYRDELQKHMTATIQNDEHKLLAIYCMPDHTHLLVGLDPKKSVSNLVQDVKRASTNFINEKKWLHGHFEWQRGYGAFSYSKSQLDNVIQYILNQEQHHRQKTFKEEYTDFLKRFEVGYKDEYLFEFYE